MSFLKPPLELRNGFKDKDRLKKIHNLPCVVCSTKGLRQTTKTVAHHKIGMGLGKKASDMLTIALCDFHHTKGGRGEAIHNTPLWEWEENFFTQEVLIQITDDLLSKQ